jgi:hypothetical protein
MIVRSKRVEELIKENRQLLDQDTIANICDTIIEKDEGFKTGGGSRKIIGVGSFLERMMNKIGVQEDFTFAECDLHLKRARGPKRNISVIRGVYVLVWKKPESVVLEQIEDVIKTVNVMKG